MIYVLDTHKLIWNIVDSQKLTTNDTEIILNIENLIYVSKVSLWEISLKYSIGSLKLNYLKPDDLPKYIEECGFQILDLSVEELVTFNKLPIVLDHKDPFDRLIIWQCIKNNFTLMSRDQKIETYKQFGLNLA
jgi:PIN domain nuclease of toxin-antitoxin system